MSLILCPRILRFAPAEKFDTLLLCGTWICPFLATALAETFCNESLVIAALHEESGGLDAGIGAGVDDR